MTSSVALSIPENQCILLIKFQDSVKGKSHKIELQVKVILSTICNCLEMTVYVCAQPAVTSRMILMRCLASNTHDTPAISAPA